MSGYNPEFDGDWDDKGDLAWNEYDWQRYLRSNEQEQARFLSLYKKMRHHPNRLDEIAHLMGWDREDWNAGDIQRAEGEAVFEGDLADEPELPEAEDMDPYTLHRHPVYIVTRALLNCVKAAWLDVLESGHTQIAPLNAVRLSNTLANAELQAVLGISSLDMGDFNLCVTHLKSSLSSVNDSFALLQELPVRESRDAAVFANEATAILFDLRDLWLRVMSECREEFRRGFRGE